MGNILYRLALILYFCITIHRYMKIFNSTQIHELDRYTVEHEPITSLDLMERAAKAIALTIMQRWPKEAPFVVFAGPGNNGGDALAVARLLAEEGYVVSVFLFNIHNHLSDDCAKTSSDCSTASESRPLMRLSSISNRLVWMLIQWLLTAFSVAVSTNL